MARLTGFFGGSAEYQKKRASIEVVYSVVKSKRKSSSVGQTNRGKEFEEVYRGLTKDCARHSEQSLSE